MPRVIKAWMYKANGPRGFVACCHGVSLKKEYLPKLRPSQRGHYMPVRVEIREIPDNSHRHAPAHTPQDGTGWQVCSCGATRRQEKGRAVGTWHACRACSTEPGEA